MHFLLSVVKNIDNSNWIVYILQSYFMLYHAYTCLPTCIMCLGRYTNLKCQELGMKNNFEFETQNFLHLHFNIFIYIYIMY